MEILKTQHESIRILASRELQKFGINKKLYKLPSKKPHPGKRCYAVPIEHLETVDVTIRADTVPIPKIFNDLVNFIRRDLKEEGIFRKEGSKVKEANLVKQLNNAHPIPEDTSIIEACAVTKAFLRNLPGHLIPKDLLSWFLEAGKLDKNADEALNLCVLLLPLPNLYLLTFLMQLFNDITKQSAQNKMTSYNMAVVIAPNIFAQTSKINLQRQSEISRVTINITKILIEKANSLGIVPTALTTRLEEVQESSTKRFYCL